MNIKSKYILCISTALTISAIGIMYIKSKQNINQDLASEALYNKACARAKEIGDVNKVLLEAIQNKDKEMMRAIQCGKDVIYDLYHNIDLADDVIEAIKQNPEFIIKNMRIQHVFFFAVQYGIIELVNVLEKHPECYEGYYVWFEGYPCCYTKDIYKEPRKLSDHDIERLKAAYKKSVNIIIQKAIKNKGGYLGVCGLGSMPDEFSDCKCDYTRTDYPHKYTYSNLDYSLEHAFVAKTLDEVFEKDTLDLIRDNMDFCLEYMDFDTISVFLEHSQEMRDAAEKNKHVLRSCDIGHLNICTGSHTYALFVNCIINMYSEALIDRICDAIAKKDLDRLGHSYVPYYKPKMTKEQENFIRENMGYLLFNSNECICTFGGIMSYFSDEEVSESIYKYLDKNQIPSSARRCCLSAIYDRCKSNAMARAKLLMAIDKMYEERIKNEGTSAFDGIDYSLYEKQSDMSESLVQLLIDNIDKISDNARSKLSEALMKDGWQDLRDKLCSKNDAIRMRIDCRRLGTNINN